MPEKRITYWRVKTVSGQPQWEQLDEPPASTAGLVGDIKVENDDQVARIFFEDEAARERVTRSARDAAALAQEWEIPHRPWQDSQPS